MQAKSSYPKRVIEIADTIFENPDKKISEIMRDFAGKCGKSPKTVERWICKAKEYNRLRIQLQEQEKDALLAKEAKAKIKKAILSREESLEILSAIAKGTARKIESEGTVLIPTDGDRTRAIQQMAKMQGWEAPVKTAHTNAQGDDIPNIIQIEYIPMNDET